jgi:hypothetical protein
MAQFVTGSVLTASSLNSAFNTQTIATATSNYTLGSANAGELVLLNSASAGTVTIPLDATYNFATGTIIEMYNSGAGSWSIATAGTASTVTGTSTTLSQYQASRLIKTAPSTWFVDGGAGRASGLDLITPTSIANSSGSASLSGGAVTFTNVSSVSLNGVFSSNYDNYRIVVNGNASQNTGSFYLRLRLSGTDASGASDYIYQVVEFSGATVTATGRTTSSFDMSYLNTTKMTGTADVLGPNLAAVTGYQLIGSRSNNLSLDGGYHNLTTQYDGFTIFTSAGTASGVVRVYGYKN